MFYFWFVFFADGFFADGLYKNNILVWLLWGITPIAIVFIFDSFILSSFSYLLLNKTTKNSITFAKYTAITIICRYFYTIICTFCNAIIGNLYSESFAFSCLLRIFLILVYLIIFFITNKNILYKRVKIEKNAKINLVALSSVSAPWFIFIPLSL